MRERYVRAACLSQKLIIIIAKMIDTEDKKSTETFPNILS